MTVIEGKETAFKQRLFENGNKFWEIRQNLLTEKVQTKLNELLEELVDTSSGDGIHDLKVTQ